MQAHPRVTGTTSRCILCDQCVRRQANHARPAVAARLTAHGDILGHATEPHAHCSLGDTQDALEDQTQRPDKPQNTRAHKVVNLHKHLVNDDPQNVPGRYRLAPIFLLFYTKLYPNRRNWGIATVVTALNPIAAMGGRLDTEAAEKGERQNTQQRSGLRRRPPFARSPSSGPRGSIPHGCPSISHVAPHDVCLCIHSPVLPGQPVSHICSGHLDWNGSSLVYGYDHRAGTLLAFLFGEDGL